MTDMHKMEILCVSKNERHQISGGQFGKNETLVLDHDQCDIFVLVLSGVKEWAGLDDFEAAFKELIKWMEGRIILSKREGEGKEDALMEVLKQFTERFWEATTDKDKKKFLMGMAMEMKRNVDEKMMEEWLAEIAEAKDRCQRFQDWSEDRKWLEFWEAIYVPAVMAGWFEIELPT